MEISYFNEFVTLAKKGKFQDAANELFISQSTLSKHIKAMESELGQILFDRTTRKAELTEFGHRFFPIAVQIATLQQNYIDLTNQFSKADTDIVIGIVPNTTSYKAVIHPLLNSLQKTSTRKTQIIEDTEARLKELLWVKECDFIMLYQTPNFVENDFNQMRVFDDKLALLVPTSDPLAKRCSISIAELKETPFVMLRPRPSAFFHDIAYNACSAAGFEPLCNVEVSRQTILYDSVHDGLGVALYSKCLATLQLELNPNYYTIVDLEESIPFSYNVLYRKYSTLPSILSALLNSLSKTLREQFAQTT